jgi:hypothetical protein
MQPNEFKFGSPLNQIRPFDRSFEGEMPGIHVLAYDALKREQQISSRQTRSDLRKHRHNRVSSACAAICGSSGNARVGISSIDDEQGIDKPERLVQIVV